MKRVLFFVLSAVSAGAALAGDNLVNFYGNTLTVAGTEGTTKLWYKPDHTFTGIDHKGAKISGTWNATDTELCTLVVGQETHCGKVDEVHKVGEKWQVGRPDGTKATLSLTAGTK